MCRKTDAICAWVDYAWKIEPKESTFPSVRISAQAPSMEVMKQVEIQQDTFEHKRHQLAPGPWYTSMIQLPISQPAPAMSQDPPPPYTELGNSRQLNPPVMARNERLAPSTSRKSLNCPLPTSIRSNLPSK